MRKLIIAATLALATPAMAQVDWNWTPHLEPLTRPNPDYYDRTDEILGQMQAQQEAIQGQIMMQNLQNLQMQLSNGNGLVNGVHRGW